MPTKTADSLDERLDRYVAKRDDLDARLDRYAARDRGTMGSAVRRGLSTGVHQTAGLVSYGAAATLEEAETPKAREALESWGLEQMAEAETYGIQEDHLFNKTEDGEYELNLTTPHALGRYALFNMAQMAVSGLPSLGSGAVATTLAGKVMKKSLAKRIAEVGAKKAATQTRKGTIAAGLAGGTAGGWVQNTGEAYASILSEFGEADGGTAMVTGLLMAGVEASPNTWLFDKLGLGRGLRETLIGNLKKTGWLKSAGKVLGTTTSQMALEGTEEYIQSAITQSAVEYVRRNGDLFSEEGRTELYAALMTRDALYERLEEGAAGAFGGTGPGVVGGSVDQIRAHYLSAYGRKKVAEERAKKVGEVEPPAPSEAVKEEGQVETVSVQTPTGVEERKAEQKHPPVEESQTVLADITERAEAEGLKEDLEQSVAEDLASQGEVELSGGGMASQMAMAAQRWEKRQATPAKTPTEPPIAPPIAPREGDLTQAQHDLGEVAGFIEEDGTEVPAFISERAGTARLPGQKTEDVPGLVAERKRMAERKVKGDKLAKQGKGTQSKPLKVTTEADMELARTRVVHPSEKQKASGNYRKTHVKIGNLPVIGLETTKNSVRTGQGAAAPWEVTMPVDYGFIPRTKSRDGDPVDVFLGPEYKQDKKAWVIDQVDAETGVYDEPKALFGFADKAEARQAYVSSFSDKRGADRIGAFTEAPVNYVKSWATTPEAATKTFSEVYKAKTKTNIESLSADFKGGPRIKASVAPAEHTDLPMDQLSRMQRASEQGFNVAKVWYHGTNRVDLEEISPGIVKQDKFLSSSPEVASDFALYKTTWSGANVIPTYIKGDLLDVEGNYRSIRDVENSVQFDGLSARDYAEKAGYAGVLFKNVTDDVPSSPRIPQSADVAIVFDSENIRSIFATFDPDQTHSRLLSATTVTTPTYSNARPDLAREVQKLVEKMTGKRNTPRLVDMIPVDPATSSRSGDKNAKTAGGVYDPVAKMITIAMSDAKYDPKSAAAHEVFHWMIDHGFLTNNEISTLRTHKDEIAQVVQTAYPQLDMATIETEEIYAYGFQIYADAKLRKSTDSPFVQAVTNIYRKLLTALTHMRDTAMGRDINRPEDIFGLIWSGEAATRVENVGPTPASSAMGAYVLEPNMHDITIATRLSNRILKDNPGNIKGAWDWFNAHFLLHSLSLYQLQTRVEKQVGHALGWAYNIAREVKLYPGYVGEELKTVAYAMADMQQTIVDNNLTIREVENFLVARFTPDREARIAGINPRFEAGGGAGIPVQRAQAFMERFKQEGKLEALSEVADKVYAILREDVARRQRWGLINDAYAATLLNTKGETYFDPITGQDTPLNAYYVPLEGYAEIPDMDFEKQDEMLRTMKQRFPRAGGGFSLRGPEYKHATGRSSAPAGAPSERPRYEGDEKSALGLLATINVIATEGAVRSQKNRVMQIWLNLAKLIEDLPGGRGFLEVNRANLVPMFNKRTGQVYYRTERKNLGPLEANTVRFKVKGKEVSVTIHGDPRIAQALTNSEVGKMQFLMRMAQKYSQWISHINTTWASEFMMTNPLKDLQTAAINLQQYELDGIGKQTAKYVSQIRLSIKQGGWPVQLEGIAGGVMRDLRGKELSDNPLTREHQQWVRRANKAGMKISFFQLHGLESSLHDMERSYKALQGFDEVDGAAAKTGLAFRKGLKAVGAVNKYVEDLNLTIDNVIRLAAFRAVVEALEAKAAKLTPEERQRQNLTPEDIERTSAVVGRDVTVDFNQHGTYGPAMNAGWVFYNATVQGAAVAMRAGMHSRKVQKIAAGLVVGGFLMSELSFWFSGGDDGGEDWYSKLLESQRHVLQRNMVLPNPLSDKGYVTIPLLHSYGFLFHMGQMASASMHGKIKTGDAVVSTLQTFVSSFMPISGWPTVMTPFMEAQNNEDWAGRKIMQDRMPGSHKPDSELYYRGVSGASKVIASTLNEMGGGDKYHSAGWLDISPESIDHVVGFSTGSGGRFWKTLYDDVAFGLKAATGLDLMIQSKEELEVRDIPFLRKLYRENSQYHDTQLGYQRAGEVDAAKFRVEGFRDEESPEKRAYGRELQMRYRDILSLEGASKTFRKSIRALRKQQNAIKDSEQMSNEEKVRRLDMMERREKQITDLWNRQYFRRVKDKPTAYEDIMGFLFSDADAAVVDLRDAVASGEPSRWEEVLNGSGRSLSRPEIAGAIRPISPDAAALLMGAPDGTGIYLARR